MHQLDDSAGKEAVKFTSIRYTVGIVPKVNALAQMANTLIAHPRGHGMLLQIILNFSKVKDSIDQFNKGSTSNFAGS